MRNTSIQRVTELGTYLSSLDPAWNNAAADTPIDAAMWREKWSLAYLAVAAFRAAITGRAGASAITLIPHTASTIVDRNSVRNNPAGGWGDSAAHSRETFERGAAAQWTVPATTTGNCMAGLAQNGDSTSNSYDSITFAIFRQSDGYTDARINGVSMAPGPNVGAGEARFKVQFDYGTGAVGFFVNGSRFFVYQWGQIADPLCFRVALASTGAAVTDVTLQASAATGAPGLSAPLVRTQWSINGVDGWHDNYFGADQYYRQSNDNGATWGAAIKGVGENGGAGVDGTSATHVFLRAPNVPATPGTNTGNPPPGWSDAPPAGTDFLWLSKATYRGSTQLTAWSAPQRISGENGLSAPLVRTQWSINGVDGWHDNYFGADQYYRQSNDNGATWGPAIKGVGEGGQPGSDGTSPSIVFRRSVTVPPAPTDNSGNPPSGWNDGPPAGSEFLWQSKATFRGATQLTSWSAPVRITGEQGASGITTPKPVQIGTGTSTGEQVLLAGGQSVALNARIRSSGTAGGGSASIQIQIAPAGSGAWVVVASGSSDFGPSEPYVVSAAGTYTNTGIERLFDVRVVASAPGAGDPSRSYLRSS